VPLFSATSTHKNCSNIVAINSTLACVSLLLIGNKENQQHKLNLGNHRGVLLVAHTNNYKTDNSCQIKSVLHIRSLHAALLLSRMKHSAPTEPPPPRVQPQHPMCSA
jgi:hypothetical protein